MAEYSVKKKSGGWLHTSERKVRYRIGFLERSCKYLQTIKGKKWSNRKKNESNTSLERAENNMLKCYGHVVRMDDTEGPSE